MKVSLITVCYNSGTTIRDTIKSVISQRYPDIEYIVVDGGSTDDTLSILNEFREHISVLISEKDNGLYDAMNKGIRAATGDIVGIINSDDFFSSDKSLFYIVNGFDDDIDAVYADIVYVQRTNINQVSRLMSSKRFAPWQIRFGFMVPHATFYVRRHLFERYGYYKTDYRVAADFELFARFVKSNIKLRRVNELIVSMREGGISSGGLRGRIHQNAEIVRACRDNGIFTSMLLLLIKIPFKLFAFVQRPEVKHVR